MPGTEAGACDELTQDVRDSRSAEALAASVEEERLARAAALGEPCLEGIYCPPPEGAGSLLAAFSREGNHRDGVQAQITEIKVNDFLDTGASVVKQQEQCSLASLRGCDNPDQVNDLIILEIGDLGVLETSRRELTEPAAALEMLGSDRGHIACEGFEDSEPVVAGAGATVSLLLQPDEEVTDGVDIEDGGVELVGAAAPLLCDVEEEELESVAVGQHRVGARVALDGEMLLEEALDELL